MDAPPHPGSRCLSTALQISGERILRLGLGGIFIWFGLLKPLGLSPAEALIAQTVGWCCDPAWFVPLLGWWEVVIGVCLIDPNRWFGAASLTRVGVVLMMAQMSGTFLPLIILPDVTWRSPGVLTLEGQYIVKNLVLIGGALYLAGRTPHDDNAHR